MMTNSQLIQPLAVDASAFFSFFYVSVSELLPVGKCMSCSAHLGDTGLCLLSVLNNLSPLLEKSQHNKI